MENNEIQVKKVTIIDTQNGTTIRSNYEDVRAETIGEFLNDIQLSINYNKYKVIAQRTQSEVDTSSAIPEAGSDGFSVLYIVARKATRSGAISRAEAMAEIKAIMAKDPSAKEFFNEGKNYTNKSTLDLEALLDKFKGNKKPVKATKTVVSKAPAEKAVCKKTTVSKAKEKHEEILEQSNKVKAVASTDSLEDRVANLEEKVDFLMQPKYKLTSTGRASSSECQAANRYAGN